MENRICTGEKNSATPTFPSHLLKTHLFAIFKNPLRLHFLPIPLFCSANVSFYFENMPRDYFSVCVGHCLCVAFLLLLPLVHDLSDDDDDDDFLLLEHFFPCVFLANCLSDERPLRQEKKHKNLTLNKPQLL